MNPYRTVLIDDHQLFNDGLRLILSNSPQFEVVAQVFDSRRAYDTCARHQPDLVLVDYNMPHFNGEAVVAQLQQLPKTCRIVIISMYAEKKEIARFKALNVDGFIAKTVPAERLLTLLDRVMQGEQIIETDALKPEPLTVSDHFRLKQLLTKREIEILKGVRQGLTTEQIASKLSLSYFTVQTHRKNISHKLPFSTKKEFYDFLELLA
ncbi:MAG: response regulator transcription factor [Spirosoma sp.]|nr:response regulator transcription factor [Spirosoma sp.]